MIYTPMTVIIVVQIQRELYTQLHNYFSLDLYYIWYNQTKFSGFKLLLLEERMYCSLLLVSLVYATCNVFETKCLNTEFAFDFTGKIFLKPSLTEISKRDLFDCRILFTESTVLSNRKVFTFKLQKRWQCRSWPDYWK